MNISIFLNHNSLIYDVNYNLKKSQRVFTLGFTNINYSFDRLKACNPKGYTFVCCVRLLTLWVN